MHRYTGRSVPLYTVCIQYIQSILVYIQSVCLSACLSVSVCVCLSVRLSDCVKFMPEFKALKQTCLQHRYIHAYVRMCIAHTYRQAYMQMAFGLHLTAGCAMYLNTCVCTCISVHACMSRLLPWLELRYAGCTSIYGHRSRCAHTCMHTYHPGLVKCRMGGVVKCRTAFLLFRARVDTCFALGVV